MISIDQLLEKKGREVWSVSHNSTVFDCIRIMEEKNIGALMVMDGDDVVGIISERDYARKVILKDRSSKQTLVYEIMTKDVISANGEMRVDESLVLMNDKRIRHLPVLDGKKLIGMISLGDVVKQIIEDQKYTIEVLEENIAWAESY